MITLSCFSTEVRFDYIVRTRDLTDEPRTALRSYDNTPKARTTSSLTPLLPLEKKVGSNGLSRRSILVRYESRNQARKNANHLSELLESDLSGSLSEASTAHHQTVLANKTLTSATHAALTGSFSEFLLFLFGVEKLRSKRSTRRETYGTCEQNFSVRIVHRYILERNESLSLRRPRVSHSSLLHVHSPPPRSLPLSSPNTHTHTHTHARTRKRQRERERHHIRTSVMMFLIHEWCW